MPEPEAAVAIVHARAPVESVLLMRRADREGDPWSGHWSFPGGRREPEDRDPLDTALRELEEECGIRLARDQMEAALPPTPARRRVGRPLLVAPFVFRVPCQVPALADPAEAVEALWTPLEVLLDPSRHRLVPVPGLPAELRYPAVELNPVPLWGFTYRLLSGWLGMASGQPGTEAANRVLDFLLARGLRLEQGWVERVARVRGTIPVADVLERFCAPGICFPPLNRLEVRADGIRMAGPAFEEYVIHASGEPDVKSCP